VFPVNKLLVFPLAFMFLLTIYSVVDTGSHGTGYSEDYKNSTGLKTDSKTGYVDVPNAGSKSFSIWDNNAGASMVIFIAAIAIGVIAGIKILGSGLSGLSQSMIFNSVLFLGLWACLSVIAGVYLFSQEMTGILWVGLTTVYIIGMGIHINGSATGD
jgi:hypothetical protein